MGWIIVLSQPLMICVNDSFGVILYSGVILETRIEYGSVNCMSYYVGIDLGGTNIKAAVIDSLGSIIVSESVKTALPRSDKAIIKDMGLLIVKVIKDAGLTSADVEAVGIGSPGIIDSGAGVVVFSNNIRWDKVPLRDMLAEYTDLPIYISNDANVAALGEVKFGAGDGYKNAVFVTLGTGVGGGIIIDGELFEGWHSAGAELGHHKISNKGYDCSCGRKDCWEVYSSATAIIRDAKAAMLKHADSLMWKCVDGDINKVEGRTAFDASDMGDKYAAAIVEEYLDNLSDGLVNIANIFRPEVILIGGGVSNRGDKLIEPLQKLVDSKIYGGNLTPRVIIKRANLGNNAGMLGAVALAMLRSGK